VINTFLLSKIYSSQSFNGYSYSTHHAYQVKMANT